jgi:stage III sporulation protein AG
VVVVAQGGGNDIIKNQIVEAVSVLFHISSYKVKVLKMEDS